MSTTIKVKFLQQWEDTELRNMEQKQYYGFNSYVKERGDIVDRNNHLLAGNIMTPTIKVDDSEDEEEYLETLDILKNEVPELTPDNIDTSKFWLKRRIDPIIVEKIDSLGERTINYENDMHRLNPNQNLLKQTLGFATIDREAYGGIEQAYDRYLYIFEHDASCFNTNNKEPVTTEWNFEKNNADGDKITLTVDRNIQFATEEILLDTIKLHNAQSAWAIIMNPKNGEILAIANVPLIDSGTPKNNFQNNRNNAISTAIEPGSIFKILAFATAHDLNILDSNEKIFCENGLLNLGQIKIRDIGGKGWLTPNEIFKYSSNIGTYKIANKIGWEKFYKSIKRFGFGEYFNLWLPEEAKGKITHEENWDQARFANISFGYGIMATSLQMLNAVNIIANEGIQVSPRILKKTSIENNFSLEGKRPIRVLSKEAARKTVNTMMGITEKGGSGKRAAIPGIEIAGKTGTSEKLSELGVYEKHRNYSSFVGFAPAKNPRISAIVIVDEPKGIAYGGYVAAPAWKKIVQMALAQTNQTKNDSKNKFFLVKK